MQHCYSWQGSRLHLILEEEIAEGYNRFTQAFFDAQATFEKEHGRKWKPTEPIRIKCDPKDKKAWDAFGRLFNLLIEINGGSLDIPEEECTEDFLIRLD